MRLPDITSVLRDVIWRSQDHQLRAEAEGYYDRIPIQVSNWVNVENTKDKIIFVTTDCEEPKVELQIIRRDDGRWGIQKDNFFYCSSLISPLPKDADVTDEQRKERAFFHAVKIMEGNSYRSQLKRGNVGCTLADVDPREVDAYFTTGNSTPFYQYC